MAAPQEVFLGFGAEERHSRKIVFHCIIIIVIIIIIIIIIEMSDVKTCDMSKCLMRGT